MKVIKRRRSWHAQGKREKVYSGRDFPSQETFSVRKMEIPYTITVRSRPQLPSTAANSIIEGTAGPGIPRNNDIINSPLIGWQPCARMPTTSLCAVPCALSTKKRLSISTRLRTVCNVRNTKGSKLWSYFFAPPPLSLSLSFAHPAAVSRASRRASASIRRGLAPLTDFSPVVRFFWPLNLRICVSASVSTVRCARARADYKRHIIRLAVIAVTLANGNGSRTCSHAGLRTQQGSSRVQHASGQQIARVGRRSFLTTLAFISAFFLRSLSLSLARLFHL